jgi:CubicO group peptidase (beta-lactamase class C family)
LLRLLLVIVVGWIITGCGWIEEKPQGKESNPELRRIMDADSIYLDLDKDRISQQQQKLDNLFQNLQKRNGFNGTVLFAEKGRIVFEKAYGNADVIKRKEPLSTDSRFELASVSKMFTAMAVMILQEKGNLGYDDDIRTYIPEWPYEGITIRQLLNHRSGLPRYESLADEKWPDKRLAVTNKTMIDLFIRHRPQVYFKPNNGFHYCNTNYALLASIVERTSGREFASFMHDYIFHPLGMKNSFILHVPDDTLLTTYIQDAGVPGHDVRGKRLVKVRNDFLNGVKGDKIMYSTVKDLYQFDKALKYEWLVKKETLEEAFTPGSPRHRGRKDNYGFGWRIRGQADSTVYHYGWWKGFRTFYLRDMQNEKTLIVLTNRDRGPGSENFWKILEDPSFSLYPASVNFRFREDNGLPY